jgi:methylated-DNA-[protein]-cysteine S-methyltransferase
MGIVWLPSASGVSVQQAFLPGRPAEVESLVLSAYPGSEPTSCPAIDELCERIERFLRGEAVRFDLQILALDRCSAFQQRVLVAESQIPRGWVSTYGRIARYVGSSGGARAVGRALATNPFPIIIPCHRAVRSDGSLGGYQGGLDMKRALLQLEGVEFTSAGRVLMNRVRY